MQVSIQLDKQALTPEEEAAITVTEAKAVSGGVYLAISSNEEQLGSIGSMATVPITECGDGLCQLGEPVQADEVLTPDEECRLEDCPVRIGTCPAPGESEVGNPTEACGGNGHCDLASLTCVCATGYAGDACEACATGYVRTDSSGYDICERDVSMQLAGGDADAPEAGASPSPDDDDSGPPPEIMPVTQVRLRRFVAGFVGLFLAMDGLQVSCKSCSSGWLLQSSVTASSMFSLWLAA